MNELLNLWQIGEHIGVSGLRGLNSHKLRKLGVLTAICAGPKPVAVIIPYQAYMTVQRLYREAQEKVKAEDCREYMEGKP